MEPGCSGDAKTGWLKQDQLVVVYYVGVIHIVSGNFGAMLCQLE